MEMHWPDILREALHAEFADRPRIAALASVDANAHPHVRHVVIRDVTTDGVIVITSDARSAKNAQFREHPAAELAVWLPGRREQFRLAGRAVVLTSADAPDLARRTWISLSDASRATFAWPTPAAGRTGADEAFPGSLPAAAPVPATFELIQLHVDDVDRLQLTPAPHRRTRWRSDNAWQPEDINP